jgi:two-component system sensor kinase FixL
MKPEAETRGSSSPPVQGPGTREERAVAGRSFGELHGRILQVSRLATIGEMATGIAHQLNQPLAAIANYAHACDRLLALPASDREAIRAALREITSETVRAGEILRRLRRLAPSQAMKQVPADINGVIEEIRELIQADGEVHGTRIRFELGADLPAVLVDGTHMQHVMLNLVRNGLEALQGQDSPQRTLCIHTQATQDGDVEIAVCDCGPGLPMEARGRLFEPFFSTKSSGTGLGLAISNTVVRAHGGILCYRDNTPRGACFYFRLPGAEHKCESP